MKISTKGRYALRFLLDLAAHKDDGFIALRDVAERQHISKKYLEQIIPVLNRAEILRANRGYQGGYKLTYPPDQYTVGNILRLTEGSLAPVACLNNSPVQCEPLQGDHRLSRRYHPAGHSRQRPRGGGRQLCHLNPY